MIPHPLSCMMNHRSPLIGWLFIFLFSFFSPLQAQKLELVLPILHRHNTIDLAFSADGKFLATCSYSEIKLWEAKTGKLIRTFDSDKRNDISNLARKGLSFVQVAIAPNGTFLIGAQDCQTREGVSPNREVEENKGEAHLQILDSRNGDLIKVITIGTCTQKIKDLTISADGTKVAVELQMNDFFNEGASDTAIFEIESGKLLNYMDRKKAIFSAQKNMFLAVAKDEAKVNYIKDKNRRHSIKKKDIKASFLTDNPVIDMAMSTNGSLISALTYNKIWTWSKKENWKARTYAIPVLHEQIHHSFSADGQYLNILDSSDPSTVTTYRLRDGRLLGIDSIDLDRGHDVGMQLAFSPDHQTLVYANRPIFEGYPYQESEIDPWENIIAVDPELQAINFKSPKRQFNFGIGDLHPELCMILLQMDSFRMHSKMYAKGQVFDLQGRKQGEEQCLFLSASKQLRCSRQNRQEVAEMGQDSFAILTFKSADRSSRLTADVEVYTPQGQLALVWNKLNIPPNATNFHYDLSKHQLFLQGATTPRFYLNLEQKKLSAPTPGAFPALLSSLDTSQFTLSTTDGTSISLLKRGDTTTLAKLLLFGEDEWVISTSSGLFDGSEKGRSTLHFVNGTEIIPLESYEARYWVPNLLEKLLAGLSPQQIRDVGALNIDEIYPNIKARIKEDKLIIDLEKRAGGLGELNLYINGSIVQKNLNPRKRSHLEVSLERYAKHYYTQRPNAISVQAFNKGEWMKSPLIELPPYTPSFPIERDHKLAHLYAIVVGTSDYEGSRLDLSYAGKDAVSIHKALTIAGGQLFQDKIDIRLFTTDDVPKSGEPTKTNIKKAIDEITAMAEPIDLVLVYLAGHGKAIEEENNKHRFYYLTQSMREFRQLEDPKTRNLDAISQEELTDWLGEMGAKKKVMVLDACNSGQVVNDLIKDRALSESQLIALDRLRDRTGMYILAGSAADRESFEATPFGQGLLTYSLLQGMKELSEKDQNREVDVLQLLMYAENQVPKLAQSLGKIQQPKMYNQDGLSSFPIGIVKDPSAIPVAAVKPILIQPLLVKEGEPEDPLDLISTLESYIQKQVRRGGTFTFRNVRKNKQGYSIRGTYSLSKERLIARVYLRKGAKKITTEDLVVEGRKDKIEELIELIFERIEPYIK